MTVKMPALLPIFRKAYWSLAALGGVYAMFCLALCSPTIQKHALYMHKVNGLYFEDVNEPEAWGFARRQVTPFNVTTADKELLYCWHILPQQVYLENEELLLADTAGPRDDFTKTKAFQLLKDDPHARVVVNLHGNAGHIAQGYRSDTYRALVQSSPHLHVLTFDYRGFGHSTGIPSEPLLLLDALSFISYVTETLGIPSDRIVILGQSLGTAVATAATLHFTDQDASLLSLNDRLKNDEILADIFKSFPNKVDFASTILVAPFPSLAELLLTYRIGGVIPVLSPIRFYPRLIGFLQSQIVDHWLTASRLTSLANIADTGRHLHFHIMHALDDADIPWSNGATTYQALASALSTVAKSANLPVRTFEVDKTRDGYKQIVAVSNDVVVSFQAVKFGGHNKVMKSVPLAMTVLRAAGLGVRE